MVTILMHDLDPELYLQSKFKGERMKKKELINFMVPAELKEAFDTVCNEQGLTRTFGLNHIMRKFILEARPEIEKRHAEQDRIIEVVQKRKRMMTFKEFMRLQKQKELEQEDDMPVGFYDSGNDDEPF